jgi:hypothetical protein
MFADIIPGISTADLELGLFVITALLFIITVFLAFLTWQNVRAANKLIELQTEPFVYIEANWEQTRPESPIGEGHILPIYIKNRGGGPARDINFVVKDDFSVGPPLDPWMVTAVSPQDTFAQTSAVKKGIKELGPYQELLLAYVLERRRLREFGSSEISFEYKTSSGKVKHGSKDIDFATLASACKYW